MIKNYKIFENISKREQLKELLKSYTDGQKLIFKRMYSNDNLDLDINDIVDNMPDVKLNWAIEQVNNTIKKLLINIIYDYKF